MSEPTSLTNFDTAYVEFSAPWIIGEPQPAIVELERAGWITGPVLDPGCGMGEHTIHLARLGYDVLGIDFAPHAIERARENAESHGVSARFEVADALRLEGPPQYASIVDSALFHVFGDEQRAEYVRALHRVCLPGGLVHVLALSDVEEGFGPRISESVIRDAFGKGWSVEDIGLARYGGVITETHREEMGLPLGERVDLAAWLARVRRVGK
jgi:SAM-dependent methyltransferase